MDFKNREWGVFVIGDIFDVSTGALLPKKVLKKGRTPRITATENNNGIFDFYKDVEHENYRTLSNFISVSFLGSVFYHPYRASLDMKIHAIQPKDIVLNKAIAHFLSLALKRTFALASYGNQISSTDLLYKKILIPINIKGNPDYDFMDIFIKKKEKKKLERYNCYIKQRIIEL